MTPLPPISGKRLCRLLELEGFTLIRASGSHFYFVHPDGRATSVPVHTNKDLPIGTLLGILRDAGIRRQHYLELLRQL
jgi:predicted RNA binding protein YcfA (HicA-like mRNA interferase family)